MPCRVWRGVGCDGDVGVGMTLEVRLHRFEKSEKSGRKTGKDGGSCKTRRGT